MHIFLILAVKLVGVECEVIQVWAVSCSVCFNDFGGEGAKHRRCRGGALGAGVFIVANLDLQWYYTC